MGTASGWLNMWFTFLVIVELMVSAGSYPGKVIVGDQKNSVCFSLILYIFVCQLLR